MAQMTVQPGAVSEQQFNVVTLTNIAGALISLALIVGIGVWGYKLLVRDVSGIPVVKAAEGPLRVQPQDPGGAEFEHQGLAVNDVAAEGAATRPADRLVLAPAPLELSLEDTPQQVVEPSVSESKEVPTEVTPQETAIAKEVETPLTAEQFADKLAENAEPLAPLQPAPEAETLPQTETAAAPNILEEPAPVTEGLGRSLRPQLRPTRAVATDNSVAEAIAASVATRAAENPLTVAEQTVVPAGTRLAQLGAFESAEVAEGEWARLSTRFSDYLGEKQPVIQRAESGGRIFYRLRAMGFADLNDARRFCSALVAQNAECIPVVTK